VSSTLPVPLERSAPVPEAEDGRTRLAAAFAAAVALHLVLLGVALLAPIRATPESAPEPNVQVEMVTSQQFAALSPAPDRPPTLPLATPKTGAEGLTAATHLMSAAILADPRSRQAREALPHLAPDERIVQLCDIEALQQVRAADPERQPEIVSAYAFAELKLSAHGLIADGAAFRSRERWYRLRFTCDVTPDLTKVTAFAFKVGDPIPKPELASHNLPLAADDD
jgi:hypothetical protein